MPKSSTGSYTPPTADANFKSWIVWGCAAAFFFFQFIVRVSPGVMADNVMGDMSISACSYGTMAAWYYVAYTSMQIPSGIILDNIGVRIPLAIAAGLLMVGCYLFSIATDVTLMSAGRFMMGLGSAFGFLSCIKTASVWFPPHKMGFVIGLSIFAGTFGATQGGYPLGTLLHATDWRFTSQVLAVIAGVIALWAFVFVRDAKNNDNPKAVNSNNATMGEKFREFIYSSIKIFTNPQMYIFGIYGAFTYIPLSAFTDLWGTPFLAKAYGISAKEAAGVVSMIYLGVAAGGPATAWLSERIQSYTKIMLIGTLSATLLFVCMIKLTSLSFYTMYPLYFAFGFFLSVEFLAFPSVCSINDKAVSATASSIYNMMCMLSGIIFQPVIGHLLDLNSSQTSSDGTAEYTLENYETALMIIPICLVIAIATTFFMREAFVKSEDATA